MCGEVMVKMFCDEKRSLEPDWGMQCEEDAPAIHHKGCPGNCDDNPPEIVTFPEISITLDEIFV